MEKQWGAQPNMPRNKNDEALRFSCYVQESMWKAGGDHWLLTASIKLLQLRWYKGVPIINLMTGTRRWKFPSL